MMNIGSLTRSIFLITVLVSALNASVYAAEYDFIANDLCCKVLSEQDRTVRVVDYNVNEAEPPMLAIPPKVMCNNKEYRVTEIGDNAFASSFINNLYLPNTIIRIGDHAFYD